MGCPTLAPETWAQIISYLPQQGDGMDGGRAAGKEMQVDYARVMCVSKLHYNLVAPLLYRRVITHDLCHLLEGINSDPIEGLLPKRSLCASIQTILLEYPDDTRLESHITYAINDALTKHRPNALKSQLSRATYARYALRAALGQADEGAMVCRIKEGTERGLVPVVGNGSAPCLVEPPGMRSLDGDDKSAISQATDEEGGTCDIGAQSSLPDAEEDELDSEDSPDCPASEDRHSLRSDIPQGGPLTNLRRLAIGSPCARTMSRRPDNFTFDTLDCIVPTQMCCWLHLDDTLPHNGDEGLLPYASIMIRDTFTPKSKGPCSIAA